MMTIPLLALATALRPLVNKWQHEVIVAHRISPLKTFGFLVPVLRTAPCRILRGAQSWLSPRKEVQATIRMNAGESNCTLFSVLVSYERQTLIISD